MQQKRVFQWSENPSFLFHLFFKNPDQPGNAPYRFPFRTGFGNDQNLRVHPFKPIGQSVCFVSECTRQQPASLHLTCGETSKAVKPVRRVVEEPPKLHQPVRQAVEEPPKLHQPVRRVVEEPPKLHQPVRRVVEEPPKLHQPVGRVVEEPPKLHQPVGRSMEILPRPLQYQTIIRNERPTLIG